MAVRRIDDDDIDARIDQHIDALLIAHADRGRGAQAPLPVFASVGKSPDLIMSLTVTSPRKRSAESTTTTRSMRCFCIKRLTAASEKPGRAVTSRSRGVINSETGRDSRVSKRKSRLVTMPTTRPFFSTTGRPEKPSRFLISIASPTLNSGPTVTGSETTPALKALDAQDLRRLLDRRQVFMDDAESARLRHHHRHRRFGHRVHRRRDNRRLQPQPRRERHGGVDLAGQNARTPGREQHIVESQGGFHYQRKIRVAKDGIEPPTQGFSVLCSTD